MSERVAMLVFNDFRNDSRVLKEARSLASTGYRVQVVALKKPDLPERERMHGFEVLRIALDPWHLRLLRGLRRTRSRSPSDRGWKRASARVGAPLARRSKRSLHDGLKTLLMPWHRSLCYLDFYRRAHRLLRDEPIRVFHAHDLNTLPVAWWLGRGRDRRVLYDSHELYVERNRVPPRSWIGRHCARWIEGRLIRRADAVITVNDSIARLLAERYGVPRPTVVMNAPDARRMPPPGDCADLRQLTGTSPEQRLLLYAGGLTFNRGLDKLIAALTHLPECHLALMGPGAPTMVEELAAVASRLGVDDRVSFLPPVPSDQVSSVAATADLGVAPIENVCMSYYLCSPNKLFEYLHAGLPVAASDFPELRRILVEHRCGHTFDPADPEDIARCVTAMLEDSAELAAMRERAQHAAGRYTWSVEETKLFEQYAALLPEPASHAASGSEATVLGEER